MAEKTDRVRLPETAHLAVNLATGAIRRRVDTY